MNRGQALAEPKWYAVHTRAGQEAVAHASLTRAGFWPFFPFDRVRKRRATPYGARRLEWAVKPYFSRYIFVALRHEGETLDGVQSVDPQTGLGMEGVATVVRSQYTGEPIRIPIKQMDLIFERAMVRLGDEDQWLAALMREIQLDEHKVSILDIGPTGQRRIASEVTESVQQAQAARSVVQPLRRAARP